MVLAAGEATAVGGSVRSKKRVATSAGCYSGAATNGGSTDAFLQAWTQTVEML